MRRRRSLLPTVLATAIALMLGAPLVAQAAVPTPLSTSGSRIVDANGNTVVLQGVNWFGFETANHAPHGLWARDYRSMLAQIRGQGFNTIRLPFSLEMIGASTTSGIDYSGGRNAALAGKSPIRVMDEIIAEAARND
ncbi:MAG: cellulase family glycosylhydrolase, partial [Gaiellales bacterium]